MTKPVSSPAYICSSRRSSSSQGSRGASCRAYCKPERGKNASGSQQSQHVVSATFYIFDTACAFSLRDQILSSSVQAIYLTDKHLTKKMRGSGKQIQFLTSQYTTLAIHEVSKYIRIYRAKIQENGDFRRDHVMKLCWLVIPMVLSHSLPEQSARVTVYSHKIDRDPHYPYPELLLDRPNRTAEARNLQHNHLSPPHRLPVHRLPSCHESHFLIQQTISPASASRSMGQQQA